MALWVGMDWMDGDWLFGLTLTLTFPLTSSLTFPLMFPFPLLDLIPSEILLRDFLPRFLILAKAAFSLFSLAFSSSVFSLLLISLGEGLGERVFAPSVKREYGCRLVSLDLWVCIDFVEVSDGGMGWEDESLFV